MSNEDRNRDSRRRFIAASSALGAAGVLWAALPFAGIAGRSFAADKGGNMNADTILFNGHVHTVDRDNPEATAVAIKDGRFLAVGDDATVMATRGTATRVIDLQRRCVIPGLNDSHLHLIRGGLNYNLELRWEGVPSLADALRMLKDQADRIPGTIEALRATINPPALEALAIVDDALGDDAGVLGAADLASVRRLDY